MNEVFINQIKMKSSYLTFIILNKVGLHSCKNDYENKWYYIYLQKMNEQIKSIHDKVLCELYNGNGLP